MRNFYKFLAAFLILLSGCSTTSDSSSRARLKEEDILSPKMTKQLITGQAKAPKSEQVKTELNAQISKWWYGHGVGRTATNIGTIVVFPPWVIYLLGNAAISLAGYEPAYITDAFPPKTRLGVLGMYDSITSVPGRINAGIAGEQFYSSPSVKPNSVKPDSSRDSFSSEETLSKNEKDKESWNRR